MPRVRSASGQSVAAIGAGSFASRDRVRADFATVASHQLRTPISIMRWALDMVLSGRCGRLTIRQREYLDRAYQQNLFMARIVGDLLRISRIEEGGVQVAFAPAHLSGIIRAVVRESQPLARAYNCRLAFSLGKNVPATIVSDSLKLREVVQTLVDNGIRYGRREGHLRMRLERRGPSVVFTVRDNGIGVPARQQKNIFTKFFRAENAIRSQTEGLGVQLYIAKHYVTSLGGTIDFRSAYRRGTTFTVTVPIRAPGPGAVASTVPALHRVVPIELRRLSDHLSDGAVFLDPAFRVIEVNGAAKRMLGIARNVSGRFVGDIVDAPQLNRFLRHRPAGEESLSVKLRLPGSGAATTFNLLLLPLRQQDIIVGWLVLLREPGAHHRADVVSAERVRREREFVSITVHELNGPLSVNKWSLEMLRREISGKLNAEQRRLVDQLHRNNERQLILVRDLLNLSRLQQGRFSINPQPSNLMPALRDVITGFRKAAAVKKIRIHWPTRQRLPKVMADPSRIAQVLTNLMSNAVKYTPNRGRVRIAVRAVKPAALKRLAQSGNAVVTHTENPRGYLLFSVQDTGIGIAPHQLPKVFTMFFRAQTVLRAKIEGTGLGLYIAKAIIELHHGDIWCQSVPQRGSTFSFSLPLAG